MGVSGTKVGLYFKKHAKEMIIVHCNIQNCDVASVSSAHSYCPVD